MENKEGNTITISFDWISYQNYNPFFDLIVPLLQKEGHRVGIIASLRDKEYSRQNVLIDNKEMIENQLPFKLDFMFLWGESETISNGALWKAQKMDQENVLFHFDVDATDMKKMTERWIFKTLDNTSINKF